MDVKVLSAIRLDMQKTDIIHALIYARAAAENQYKASNSYPRKWK